MKKKSLNRDLLILSILTAITVLTWIGFDLYRALIKPTLPEILEKQLEPLTPEIDKERLRELKKRIKISREELEKIKEIVPPKPSPETTPSGETLPGSQATEGGGIRE